MTPGFETKKVRSVVEREFAPRPRREPADLLAARLDRLEETVVRVADAVDGFAQELGDLDPDHVRYHDRLRTRTAGLSAAMRAAKAALLPGEGR